MFRISHLLIIISLFLGACTAIPISLSSNPWKYADLRGLDQADSKDVELDLIAMYIRTIGTELQIRLDFLDHAPVPRYDLYLAIDTQPGGSNQLPINHVSQIEWDSLLVIPAAGSIQTVATDGKHRKALAVRILRDPTLDTITISLNRSALQGAQALSESPRGISIEAFLTDRDSLIPKDTMGPFNQSDLPPPAAPVLFAFWDAYLAYTPAMALRRWDGAHTGPLGGRHGLYNLLRTAYSTRTPLVLLDLSLPASLSALDFTGNIEFVRMMVNQGLLTLPNVLPNSANAPVPLPSWAVAKIFEQNERTNIKFELPVSEFIYAPNNSLTDINLGKVIFTIDTVTNPLQMLLPRSILRWDQHVVVPIPVLSGDEPEYQALDDGPSLEVRKAIISTALTANQWQGRNSPPILVLGGDLPSSTWGVPQFARATFRYLAAHPWVKVLNAHDLISFAPSGPYIPPPTVSNTSSETNEQLLSALENAPQNNLGLAAWQAYQALFAAIYPQTKDVQSLRNNYIGQLWSLLYAARWAESPTDSATCNIDVDHDGREECLLANQWIFAEFESEDGALKFLFFRDPNVSTTGNVHQVVAPSSQFITGLSASSTWELRGGCYADPSAICSAFSDNGTRFIPTIGENSIIFTTPDNLIIKSYTLSRSGLKVYYNFGSPEAAYSTHIPIALDPWSRFSTGWSSIAKHSSAGDRWNLKIGTTIIDITSSANLVGHSFLDSIAFISLTENPNHDYPPGHFLPFPMALLEVIASSNFEVNIDLVTIP